jgi:hypothetical protein
MKSAIRDKNSIIDDGHDVLLDENGGTFVNANAQQIRIPGNDAC